MELPRLLRSGVAESRDRGIVDDHDDERQVGSVEQAVPVRIPGDPTPVVVENGHLDRRREQHHVVRQGEIESEELLRFNLEVVDDGNADGRRRRSGGNGGDRADRTVVAGGGCRSFCDSVR